MQHKYEDPVPEFNGDFSYGKVYTAKSNKGIELLLVSVQDVEDEIAMITKQAGVTNISTSFRISFKSFVQQTFCNIDKTNIPNHPLNEYRRCITQSEPNDLWFASESIFNIWRTQPAKIHTQIYATRDGDITPHPHLFIKGYLVFDVYSIRNDSLKLEIQNASYRTDALEFKKLSPLTQKEYNDKKEFLLTNNVMAIDRKEKERLNNLLGLRKQIFGY